MPDHKSVEISLIVERATVCITRWSAGTVPASLVPPGLGGQVRLLQVGPREWWVVSDHIEGPKLCDRLKRHSSAEGFAAVDQSSGIKVIKVEGPAAGDLLNKGCGLDLHPRIFPAGQSTRTRMAQASVIIECVNPTPRFDLYVGRSYQPHLHAWLTDAALEFKNASHT
jgi:sarcosine oxidase subunit gamma